MGATCLRNMSWTTVTPQCVQCPANCAMCSRGSDGNPVCTSCSGTRTLYSNHCLNGNGQSATSPMEGCHVAKAANVASGNVWITSSVGTAYLAYCLNDDNTRGWGSVYGGGWEIVSTQLGGHGQPSNAVSNAALRRSPPINNVTAVVLPDITNASGRPTQRSSMSAAWGQRAAQPGESHADQSHCPILTTDISCKIRSRGYVMRCVCVCVDAVLKTM